VNGPQEPGPEPVLGPGEAVEGHLLIVNGGAEERLPVGAKALERGIILGRYSRCSGDTSVMTDLVSRVHAVVISVDDQVHIIDAGSTNGIVVGEAEVKCAPVESGATYSLGRMLVRWEPAH
jgi:FHA domain